MLDAKGNLDTECKDSEEAKKYPKGRKLQLRLFMYVEEIEIIDKPKKDKNYIFLDGYLCREPAYRRIKDENKDEYFDRTFDAGGIERTLEYRFYSLCYLE